MVRRPSELQRVGGMSGRARTLRVIAMVVATILSVKMAYLQLARGEFYRVKADEQHQGTITLPARRGDIRVMSASGEETALATDVSLDLVYIDPAFMQSEATRRIDATSSGSIERTAAERTASTKEDFTAETLATLLADLPPVAPNEQLLRGDPLPADPGERRAMLKTRILELMHRKEVTYVPLLGKQDMSPELITRITDLKLAGVTATEEGVSADPTKIEDLAIVAGLLAPAVDVPVSVLEEDLRRRPIRYLVLKRKLTPEISKQISDLRGQGHLVGVGLLSEHWRFYPEKSLASSVVGFVNREGRGQYGAEETYDDPQRDISLRGVDGSIRVDRDPKGRQIAVGEEVLTPARDGDDIVLTLDRVVQRKMEEILADAVQSSRGEKGALVVMEPQTGRIIAMASYPTFDPNQFEDVMARIQEGPERGAYVNTVGPLAYSNVAVDIPYEPGSVMKVLTMAAGIDVGEISPDTVTYDRTGMIEVDNYIVRNSTLKAEGRMTMTNVLERSSNLGAAFVSRKLGRTLTYSYFQSFGMGQLTDIELASEHKGWMKEPQTWADIDLVTASFGQGISATPIQMVAAVGAIANGGKLMRPTIISKIVHAAQDQRPREEEVLNPRMLRQVIRPDTAAKLTGMMVSVIDHGVAPKAKVPGYVVAGKTGTSQIAKENGAGYEKGPGSTVATLCGFAPAAAPRVVVYIRIDRPLADQWGSTIAAPAWSRAVTWLMRYYNIAPSR